MTPGVAWTAACSVEGCHRAARKLGMCVMHYRRVRAHGAPGGAESIVYRSVCSILGCPKPHKARGWCAAHYATWQRTGDPEPSRPTVEERFWAKVDKTETCWLWTGAIGTTGYGNFGVGGRTGGRTVGAHIVAWELANGPVPEGMRVLHECDIRACVRHLFLGTQADNLADMVAKGRQARGEQVSNSKLTRAQVEAIRASTGTQRAVAAAFGISQSHVGLIRARKVWAHV